jgi:hypothetical protein
MTHTHIRFALVLFCACTHPAVSQREIVINEIMYAPESGKPEWVELYNGSGKPVSLKNWGLHDATSSRPVITVDENSIAPDGYRVLCRDASLLEDYPELDTLLVIMDKLPSLNNTGDDLVLCRDDRTVVDSLRYASGWGGSGDRSLERIDCARAATDRNNWATSTAVSGATPGKRNSVAAAGHDLCLAGTVFEPSMARRKTAVQFSLHIRNDGVQRADSIAVSMYEDRNRNGIAEDSERVCSWLNGAPLEPRDSIAIPGILPASEATTRVLITVLTTPCDERLANNRDVDTVQFGACLSDVVVNEIMYAPENGESEWIEVLNPGPAVVDMADWSIGDRTSWRVLPSSAPMLLPGQYLVLAADTVFRARHPDMQCPILILSLPSYNNDGDDVRMKDALGFLVDSVSYRPDWGGSDRVSLERRNAIASSTMMTNWGSSEDTGRCTPGRRNSIVTLAHDIAVTRIEQDASNVVVVIRNDGLLPSGQSRVHLLQDDDEDLAPDPAEWHASLAIPSLAPGDSCMARFSESPVPQGVTCYLAFTDSSGDERRRNDTTVQRCPRTIAQGSLRLNEIMYEPLPGESEWVEYVNTTAVPLNIEACALTDAPMSDGKRTMHVLARRVLRVPPDGFLVIASDSAIFRRYPFLVIPSDQRSVVVLSSGAFSLSNSGDEIVFIDPLGGTVDSLRYSSGWHHPRITATAGFSLERINPELPGEQPTSWSTSCAAAGGTPGGANSIFTAFPQPRDRIDATLRAAPNPFSPDRDGFEDVCIFSWSIPASVAQIRVRIFDTQGLLVRTLNDLSRSGEHGEIAWDGSRDDGAIVRVGIYIAILDAVDSRTNAAYQATTVVAAATRQ